MLRHLQLTLLFCCAVTAGCSQSERPASSTDGAIFNRIAKSMQDFRMDTTAPPNDKITKQIITLRALRGGFNINEAIAYKIEEDRQKQEVSKEESDQVASFFKSGDGKKWLDNATIWIYRQHFTYGELKQLVKFYKTPAGQKMATDFPVIMIQSLKAAEMIRTIYTARRNKTG